MSGKRRERKERSESSDRTVGCVRMKKGPRKRADEILLEAFPMQNQQAIGTMDLKNLHTLSEIAVRSCKISAMEYFEGFLQGPRQDGNSRKFKILDDSNVMSGFCLMRYMITLPIVNPLKTLLQ